MHVPDLLPRARTTSRVIALAAGAAGLALSRRPPGSRAQQGVVLAALALGMPHGAADTELLRAAAEGRRDRHLLLASAYAAVAAAATVVVRRGGGGVERAVLLASAAHFAEGEAACWGAPPGGHRRARTALRLLAAAATTVVVPAAVGVANRRPPEVGVSGALEPAPRAAGEATGLALLRDRAAARTVAPPVAVAAAAVVALAATGDLQAAGDTALLLALPLGAPPSVAFAAYFGGWHAVRHTARVLDALVADGQLPAPGSLPAGMVELTRRSAWAAVVGVVVAGALAAADPDHASDNAFAAVLGLTVPHMATVAGQLSRRGR